MKGGKWGYHQVRTIVEIVQVHRERRVHVVLASLAIDGVDHAYLVPRR